MRNRHLDVKGLYSHSYASEVYKSRTQILTFVEVSERKKRKEGGDGCALR